jgi:pre-mRNA-processing factor 6
MSGYGTKPISTFNMAPPTNYVAGIGRGAIGFTTRSDIGPARPAYEPEAGVLLPSGPILTTPTIKNPFIQPNFGQAPPGYVAGRGRGMGDLARSQSDGDTPGKPLEEVDRGDYSESNFDEFSGYSERLFSSGMPYEEDDREADQIYSSVDKAMEKRNKRNREKEMLEIQNKNKNVRPSIGEQFADLKRELGTVSADEWSAIPEVGDSSLKHKQTRKKETYVPVPDAILESAGLKNSSYNKSIDPNAGTETPFTSGTQTVTTGLAEARGHTLTSKLDTISDSVSGQTVVDPKGYLTNLNSLKISSEAEVGDIKKARALLSSVTSTNPKHAPGWIAAAR